MALYNVVMDAARISDSLHETELKVEAETGNYHLVYLYPRNVKCGEGYDMGDQQVKNGGASNTTDWENSGTTGKYNGIGQYWEAYKPGGSETFISSVLDPAGNGFTGRAQKYHNISGTYLLYNFDPPLAANTCWHFSMKYRYYGWVEGNGQFGVTFTDSNHSGSGYGVNENNSNAILTETYFSNTNDIYYIQISCNAAATCYLEIDEVKVYQSI